MAVAPRATSATIPAVGAKLADHTRHQIALRLLPFLFIVYIINYLDRTSVAYAAIGMSRTLGFSDRVVGLGISIFFVSYLALQIPGTLMVERWGARRSITLIMIAWGSLTVLTGLVHSPHQLYGARLLLGAAEAGFFPGVVVYLSHWFIREDRAKAGSNFMAAIPLSFIIGSPLAGWILGHPWLGVDGWRWLFVLEGMPAVLLGTVAFFYLTDWPKDAAWLAPEQREWIEQTLEEEKPVAQTENHSVAGAAFGSYRVAGLGCVSRILRGLHDCFLVAHHSETAIRIFRYADWPAGQFAVCGITDCNADQRVAFRQDAGTTLALGDSAVHGSNRIVRPHRPAGFNADVAHTFCDAVQHLCVSAGILGDAQRNSE